MAKTLYVGNLSFHTEEEKLRSAFAAHGSVSDARIVLDRETGRSRGFGFVEMEDDNEADAAIRAMNGADLDGRPLRDNEARPRGDGAGSRRSGPRSNSGRDQGDYGSY